MDTLNGGKCSTWSQNPFEFVELVYSSPPTHYSAESEFGQKIPPGTLFGGNGNLADN